MSRDLESFERELQRCNDWRDAFKVALDGLMNNTFTWSLQYIDELNLPTLENSHTAAYVTIKDRRIREGLVASGLFQVARLRGPGAIEDLEICWDTRIDSYRLLRAVVRLAEARDSMIPPPGGGSRDPYAGGEAAKVFIRALDAVISEIKGCNWARFDVLHKIALGEERKHGSPLDEIRISVLGKGSPLTEALRRVGR